MGSIVRGVIKEFDLHKGLRVENKRAGFDGRPSSSGGALQSGEKAVDRERERKIRTAGGKPEGMEEATAGGLGFRESIPAGAAIPCGSGCAIGIKRYGCYGR
ncbi:hypothetical protein F0562_019631 [Nyssa sinensis]|uniref:Uncharacterized protein n=1 Tax=Nyssa sinensis TaxID=561372 RepID=A0A5J5BSU1_9ASTE|nr:hypothetical protein F0562_019631 [Nyssa sinensis]